MPWTTSALRHERNTATHSDQLLAARLAGTINRSRQAGGTKTVSNGKFNLPVGML